MDDEQRARAEAIRLGLTPRQLRRLNDAALRRRARLMIEQGLIVERPDHSLVLTAQGRKRLAHLAPELLERILRRELAAPGDR